MWLPLFHQKDFGNNLLQGGMIFMDEHQKNKAMIDIMRDKRSDSKSSQILILHHYVQSLKNKLLGLPALLQSDLKHFDTLCKI